MTNNKVNPLTHKRADKNKYYIDPEQLKQEIISCQTLSCCTEQMGQMLILISDKVYNLPKYNKCSQQDKEDMKSFNLLRWLKRGLYTLDLTKENCNPFSYITHGTELNGIRYLQIEQQKQDKRQRYIAEIIRKYQRECREITNVMKDQLKYFEDDDVYM